MMLYYLAIATVLPLALARNLPSQTRADYSATCRSIESAISSASAVFYPNTEGYQDDIAHWVTSSEGAPACSVEPGTAADVSSILGVLAQTDTPFGIKSGGHSANPTFSSTLGVHIALSRFNSVDYDASSETVAFGAGLTWDEVFGQLEPYNRTIVGGRIVGVGVGGYILGGGYSWISSRYGLSIDNIIEYELVLPTGEIVNVNDSTEPDLFFGLKGGFNNFGIVTKFTFGAIPIGAVWGGLIHYDEQYSDQIIAAVADLQATASDPDAALIAQWTSTENGTTIGVQFFYNGPEAKNGIFDQFLAIPSTTSDVGTRSFLSFLIANSADLVNLGSLRGRQNTVPLPNLTTGVLSAGVNITKYLGNIKPFAKGAIASTAFEPLIASAIIRADLDASAYPHDKYTSPNPIYYFWDDEADDEAGLHAILQAGDAITTAVEADGQDLEGVVAYNNYASDQVTVESLYSSNLPRLQTLRAKYDPQGVMKRTGGYKF